MTFPQRSSPRPLLIALAYVGFVSLGLPDAVLGVAWPTIRDTFQLPQRAIGLVFVTAVFGYSLSSFLSGRLTMELGIGLLLAGSTALVGSAMLGFATAPAWALFVSFAVLHGLGSGAIDAGLNGWAAHSLSARHMNWLHACYCFGAMLGPLLMTAVLTSGRHYSLGYGLVSAVMLTLSVVFLITRPLWGRAADEEHGDLPKVSMANTLGHPEVLLQMAVFLLYTGLESGISQWTFTVLTESRGASSGPAGVAVGLYWGSIGVGRVIFGTLADRIGIDRLLRYSLLVAGAGTILFAMRLPVPFTMAALAIIGIGLSPVFPCLMTRTPERLGRHLSAHAVGFQVAAAMIGAAALPGILGLLAGQTGLESVPRATVFLATLLWLLHEVLLRRPDHRIEAP